MIDENNKGGDKTELFAHFWRAGYMADALEMARRTDRRTKRAPLQLADTCGLRLIRRPRKDGEQLAQAASARRSLSSQ